jgi:hypothetical protein
VHGGSPFLFEPCTKCKACAASSSTPPCMKYSPAHLSVCPCLPPDIHSLPNSLRTRSHSRTKFRQDPLLLLPIHGTVKKGRLRTCRAALPFRCVPGVILTLYLYPCSAL